MSVNFNGVRKFCCEDISLIENYDKAITDKTKTWDCHHRLESHTSDGELRFIFITSDELKALDLYYQRPASELIFLTCKEHRLLHNNDIIVCRKRSKTNKGLCFYNNGIIEVKRESCPEGFNKGRLESVVKKSSEKHKGLKHSEESKKYLSEKFKGRFVSKETREKKSNSIKGLKFFTNGKETIRARECPEGYVPGRHYKIKYSEEAKQRLKESAKHRKPVSEETREKHRLRNKNRKWYNNGVINKFVTQCPEGFVPGRLLKGDKR